MSDANIKQPQLSAADLYSLVKELIFAMAQQDVRYFLNGMLFDFDGQTLTAVAISHRLATNSVKLPCETPSEPWKVIIPRKTISELLHISPMKVNYFTLNEHHIGFTSPLFTSHQAY